MTKTRVLGALLLVALSLAPNGAAHAGRASQIATIELVGISDHGSPMQRQDFPLHRLRDLQIQVWWSVPGRHVEKLRLIAPDGALYQQFVVTFDGDDWARRNGKHGGDVLVETLLPVGGTWITEYSMHGSWTIEVYMDDGALPVATSSFTLWH